MPPPDQTTMAAGPNKPAFTATHWSVVLAANDSDPEIAHEALTRLCRSYWYPLYIYVRRAGSSTQDAEDLTQAFFERLLEKKLIGKVCREKGKFRSFLLASLKNFLVNEWEKTRTRKRGGAHPHFSLEENREERYFREPADSVSPEKLYHRRWALTLLEKVVSILKSEYARAGQAEQFDAMKEALSGGAVHYPEMAARFSTSEGALRVWVHRLRKRYREILREEVAQTVETEGEVEEELRFLLSALE